MHHVPSASWVLFSNSRLNLYFHHQVFAISPVEPPRTYVGLQSAVRAPILAIVLRRLHSFGRHQQTRIGVVRGAQ